MSTYDIIVQLIGFIAWLLLTISYYRKNTDKILAVQVIGNLLFCLHYLLLKAYSGLGICFLELIRDFSYYKTDLDDYIFAYSIPVYVLGAVLSFKNKIELLPIIASITDGWSLTKKKKIVVIGGIFSYGLWLVYDLSFKSYSGAITDVITMVSNIYILFTTKDKKIRPLRSLK